MSSVTCARADWELGRYSVVRWQGKHEQRRHEHAEPRIVLLIEGHFEERIGGRALVCEPGTAIYRHANEPHSDRYGEAGAYVSVALGPNGRDVASLAAAARAPRVVRRPALRSLGCRLAAEILRPDAWSPLAAQGLVFEAVATLARAGESDAMQPAWLTQALDMVRADPTAHWGAERIANAVGVSRTCVARGFRKHAGAALGDYVRRLRLEEAQALLVGATMPIAGVASSAGFYDQSHLNRCFRRAFGVTPAEYRSNHRR